MHLVPYGQTNNNFFLKNDKNIKVGYYKESLNRLTDLKYPLYCGTMFPVVISQRDKSRWGLPQEPFQIIHESPNHIPLQTEHSFIKGITKQNV